MMKFLYGMSDQVDWFSSALAAAPASATAPAAENYDEHQLRGVRAHELRKESSDGAQSLQAVVRRWQQGRVVG